MAKSIASAVRLGKARAGSHLPQLERAARSGLKDAGVVALANFDKFVTRHIVADGQPDWSEPNDDEILSIDMVVQSLKNKLDPVRKAIVAAAVKPVVKHAGISYDADSPFIAAKLEKTGSHVTGIAETTRREVMAVVHRSYQDGLSIPDTAKAIQAYVQDASQYRAEAIARTEMTALTEGGGLAAIDIVSDATGVEYTKTWLTAPGSRDPRHETYDGLDGQTVPLDQPFDVGGDALMYPGDPDGSPEETVNCRCTLIYPEGGEDLVSEDLTGSVESNGLKSGGTMRHRLTAVAAATSVEDDTAVEVPVKASQLSWEATLLVEGEPTDDGRMIAEGATTWRDLPLTLMAQIVTDDGHDGAQVAGRIDQIFRVGNRVMGAGVFDDGEFGSDIARLVGDGTLRGVSVDLAIREFEYVSEEATEGDDSILEQLLSDSPPLFLITDGVIGAATVCSFPAFSQASIALSAAGQPLLWCAKRQHGMTISKASETSLTAAAAGLAMEVPLAEWFVDPELPEPTAITVTEDGRIFGHAAVWELDGAPACHIGIEGRCVQPPHSMSDYAFFHLGETTAMDGSEMVKVSVGQVTLDTGHASLRLSREIAKEHYDNTGVAVADVAVGEDEFGIWVAGALRSETPAEKIASLRAAKLSGDWRDVDGNLELVALLAVNVPGFPVPRTRSVVAAVEDDFVALSLVAAGLSEARAGWSDMDRGKLRALAAAADGGVEALAGLARG